MSYEGDDGCDENFELDVGILVIVGLGAWLRSYHYLGIDFRQVMAVFWIKEVEQGWSRFCSKNRTSRPCARHAR